MRPTLLKPGMTVLSEGVFGPPREMLFLRRERQPCRAALNYFRCDAYRGINGPTDDGTVTMTDYRVSRFVSVKPTQEAA
jgi:hypothetical protein